MSARNMEKIIANAKMDSHYEMNSDELWRLANAPDKVQSMMDAFVFGFALGQRALKAELKRKERSKSVAALKVV